MDLKVSWTDTAKFQLEDIFDFHKSKASLKVAQKIIRQIIDKANFLKKHPNTGQIEELLIDRSNAYRYLVEGNYKIIYWVEENYIKIASVFDCRQNPEKMKKI